MKPEDAVNGKAAILKVIQNPNNTHPYTVKRITLDVNNRLGKEGININFTRGNFLDIVKYFNLKQDPAHCFVNEIYQSSTYSYSAKTVDFIVSHIKENPDFCQEIRQSLKQKKEG